MQSLSGALRDAHVTNQAGEHGGAKLSDGQAVMQGLDKIAGEQVGGDQVSASRNRASDVSALVPAVIRNKETLGAATVAVL